MWRGGFSGEAMSRDEFATHVKQLAKQHWVKHLVLHNSGAPNMRQARNTPGGFRQRVKNLEHYYKNQKKWAGGPHGFIFEDGNIYLGTPLDSRGTHSPSFNGDGLGFEMMADFRPGIDDPTTGGGFVIYDTAAFVFATICSAWGLPPDGDTIKLHKEDRRTSHDCPGALVTKPAFLAMVRGYMTGVPMDEAEDQLRGGMESVKDGKHLCEECTAKADRRFFGEQ